MTDSERAEHRALIDAVNLLAEYATKHIADGFEIVLHFNREEAYMDLTNLETGNDIEIGHSDWGWSSFAVACEDSHGEPTE